MKKILIVNKSFAVGGIQSSMLNLIEEIKKDYEVHLCVFYPEGKLKERLPKEVKLIKVNKFLQMHGMTVNDAKGKGLLTYLFRAFIGFFAKIFTNKLFFSLSLLFQKKLKGYDVAIAFHHEDSVKAVVSGFYRFVLKKTDARIKLGWIHYDPYNVSFEDNKNEKYMNKMSKIICVSKGTANIFKKKHPNLKTTVDYVYNFQNINLILKKASEFVEISENQNTINCFSACRFAPQKDMPRAIRALAPVLKDNKNIKWYIAGDGPDMPEVKKIIHENNIKDSIILLGALSNPYPYFLKCDLYIQPSIYEAAPMVYGEALICKIPILTTDNISAKEMVSKEYGVICDNNEESLRKEFARIVNNKELLFNMKKNLNEIEYSNNEIKRKIDILFEKEQNDECR